MYLLRRFCGISAHEAQDVLPVWEVDLLLTELKADLAKGGE